MIDHNLPFGTDENFRSSIKQNIIYNDSYLIPLYRAASEKVRNSEIRIKRLLTPMHFFFGLSGTTRNPRFELCGAL
jgi:hypothetical protein